MGFSRQEYWNGVLLPSLNHQNQIPGKLVQALPWLAHLVHGPSPGTWPRSRYTAPLPLHGPLPATRLPSRYTVLLLPHQPPPLNRTSPPSSLVVKPTPSTPVHAKLLQSCPALCDPVDCSPPGSSVHGILQARILEWVAIPFSRGIFLTQGLNLGLPYCKPRSPTLQADSLLSEPSGKPIPTSNKCTFTEHWMGMQCRARL